MDEKPVFLCRLSPGGSKPKPHALPHLLLRALIGLDRVVDVLHRPLNETDRVWPLGLGVDTLLCHNSCNVPEHGLQLTLPLPVRHLELSFGQDLSNVSMK